MINRVDFDTPTEQAVWNKGAIINGYSPNLWKIDDFSRVMKRDEYGNRNSEYGWEIDHILPLSQGGDNTLQNLRPLNWQFNVARNQ